MPVCEISNRNTGMICPPPFSTISPRKLFCYASEARMRDILFFWKIYDNSSKYSHNTQYITLSLRGGGVTKKYEEPVCAAPNSIRVIYIEDHIPIKPEVYYEKYGSSVYINVYLLWIIMNRAHFSCLARLQHHLVAYK